MLPKVTFIECLIHSSLFQVVLSALLGATMAAPAADADAQLIAGHGLLGAGYAGVGLAGHGLLGAGYAGVGLAGHGLAYAAAPAVGAAPAVATVAAARFDFE